MKQFAMLIALASSLTGAGNTHGQEWQVLASFYGRSAMGIFAGGFESTTSTLMDFDGDGLFDTTIWSPTSGLLIMLNTFTSTGPEIVRPCPALFATTPRSGDKLMGFFNFDGIVDENNPKEILFAQQENGQYINPIVFYNIDASYSNCSIFVPDQGTILIGGWDTDGNGVFELVIGDENKNDVQVWGVR